MEITPIQLAILCDWTKERAIHLFYKIEYPEIEPHLIEKPTRKELANWRLPVSKLESSSGIAISTLIESVRRDFTKNKHCMEYVYKDIASKIKSDKKTGFFPLFVSIPADVDFLITEEQREHIKARCFEYLPDDIKFKIEKHGIQIK